jgi:hypothetical protein
VNYKLFQILDHDHNSSLVSSIAGIVVGIGIVRAAADEDDGVAAIFARDFGDDGIAVVAIVGTGESLRQTAADGEAFFVFGADDADDLIFAGGDCGFPKINAVNFSRCSSLADDGLCAVIFGEFEAAGTAAEQNGEGAKRKDELSFHLWFC